MRKADREITDVDDLKDIMEKCQVCRLAIHDAPFPYIVPLSFGYRYENAQCVLYFHCAKEGKKIDLISRNNRVSFEMDRMVNLILKAPACKSTMEYESIFGFGTLDILTEDAQKKAALTHIMSHYMNQSSFEFEPSVFEKTEVLRLNVIELTGKRLKRNTQQQY